MNIQEIILCKFGEVVLKGANRQSFESQLIKELRRRASPHGVFKIYYKQSTVYVEPLDEQSHEPIKIKTNNSDKSLFISSPLTVKI